MTYNDQANILALVIARKIQHWESQGYVIEVIRVDPDLYNLLRPYIVMDKGAYGVESAVLRFPSEWWVPKLMFGGYVLDISDIPTRDLAFYFITKLLSATERYFINTEYDESKNALR